MKILHNKTITDVPYITACGIKSGVKKSGKKDLSIIYSQVKACAAAVFTTNKVKAAPILLNMGNIKSDNIQAIVINSGIANACTGDTGYKNAKIMAETAANCLNINPSEVLVQSTGIIGKQLPMELIVPGIEKACSYLSKDGGNDASIAIMTTDTFQKTFTVEFEIQGKPIIMSGIAKGSGMIHPNMATMLSSIVTNANISKEILHKALKSSVEKSYNMISVDGDTSTNDMVTILANKTAGNTLINCTDKNYEIFKEALDFVNITLAKMIAKDGEGATKLIEATVLNAQTLENARKCAKSIICSNLTKCAFFGSDANWGRIMCAIGYSGADFNPYKVDIYLEDINDKLYIVKNGVGLEFDKNKAKEILSSNEIKVTVDLKSGTNCATAWGCDLSYDYVKINGCYTT
ncbi:bifunctional ornithine acetyltransferase/N-acetylglutamate synthase [Clostridium sp. Marseille-Q2269]|uniref:bifunctional ornithine acetyltransferase/N-acetylglutamate synthase n=1 Tax=Clostridium sp. Marseille-Q2269 TaxID=2942205 RepID=UPI002074ABA7|nr:bifunctional ornithine acetyltransferase/N-acetylglutamate synthase [Clostridium sp. Marseille-Q2269]